MQAHNYKPVTRRCVYCRPRCTWGVRRWSLLGRLYDIVWPPHVMGHDYGPPYTDGICPAASRKLDLWLEARAHAKAGLKPPVYAARAREFEVSDLLIAIFAAIVLIQYGWNCRQDRRIENYKAMLLALPLDVRAQNGAKP